MEFNNKPNIYWDIYRERYGDMIMDTYSILNLSTNTVWIDFSMLQKVVWIRLEFTGLIQIQN